MENVSEKNDTVNKKVVVVKYNDYHSLKTLCEQQQKDQKTKPTEISRNATPKNVSVISKVSNRVITSPTIYPLYTPINSSSKCHLSQSTRSYKGPNSKEKKNVTIKGKLLDRSTSLSKNSEEVLDEENVPISVNKTQQEASERRNKTDFNAEIPTALSEYNKEKEEKFIEPIEKEEEINRAQKYLASILISDSPEKKLFTREELKEIPEKIFESPIKHSTEESDLKNLCIKNEDGKPFVSQCSIKIQNQMEASESKEVENFLVAGDKKNIGLDLNLESKTPLKKVEMSEADAKIIKQMDEFILQIEGENAFLKIKTEDESNKENLDFPRDVIEKIVDSIYSNLLPEDLAEFNQCLNEIKQVAQLEKFEDTTKQNVGRSLALNVSKKENVEFEETLKTETSENGGEETIIGFIPKEVDTLEKLVREIGINTEREETIISLNGFEEDDRLGAENIEKSEPLTYLIENTIDQEAPSSESIIDSKYYIVDSISNDSPKHVNIIQQYEPFIYLQEDTSHRETPTSDSVNDLNSFDDITNSNTLPVENLITTVTNTKAIETFSSDECSVVIINDGFFLPIDIENNDPNISQSVSEDRGTDFSKEAGQLVTNKPDKTKRVSKEVKKREMLMLLEQARAVHSTLPENCEDVEFKKYNLKSLFRNIKEHVKVAKKLYEKLEVFAESATRSINRSLEAEEVNTLQGDLIFMKNLIEKTFVKEETKKPKYKVVNITKRDDRTKSVLTSNKSLSKKFSGLKTVPKVSRHTSDKALHQTLNRMNKILDAIEQNSLLSKCVKQSSKKNSTYKSKGRDKSRNEANGFETEEETQDLEIISDDSELTIPKKSSSGLKVCDKSLSVVLNTSNSNVETDVRHEEELVEENSAKAIYQDKEFRKSELQSKIKRRSKETLEKSKRRVGKDSYRQITREDTTMIYKNKNSPRYYLRSQKLNPFAKENYSKDKLNKNKKEIGYDVDYSSVIPLDKIGSPSCNYTLTNDSKPCIVLYNKKCEPQKSIFRNPFAKLEKRYFTRNSWKDILECETTKRYSLRSRTPEKRESFLERLSSKA